MRQRLERKVDKQLRRLRHQWPDLVSAMYSSKKQTTLSWGATLSEFVQDTSTGWISRGMAARVLALVDRRTSVFLLLEQFFRQDDKFDLWETALSLEDLGERAAVGPLVRALQSDPNPDRRHAAARTLGWIPKAGPRAASALVQALVDQAQPQQVREEAAESLAYCHYPRVIPPLLSVLDEPDVRIRFWAVFALGTRRPGYESHRPDAMVLTALQRMLADEAVPPGNWWSVGREALAMLGKLDKRYDAALDAEVRRVLDNPNASPEDRRWAESYVR